MTEPLEPYQLDGARFLASRRQAFLADEPGVGKTAQAIHACDLIGAQNILVLVPASVRVNWLREFEKFSPFDRPGVAIMDGKSSPAPTGITVCSYALVTPIKVRKDAAQGTRKKAAKRKSFRESLLSRQWDVIILDEAHGLKERKSSVTRAVYGRECDGASGLAASAARVWRLSGTPQPNYADELWTHLRSAGLYTRDYYAFVDEFCTGFTSDYGFKITGTRNADRLKAILKPFVLRRKKADVVPKLPLLEVEHVLVEPSVVDEEVYFTGMAVNPDWDALHVELRQQNDQIKNAMRAGDDALAFLQQLAPTAGTLRRYVGLSKVPGYLDLIKPELAALKYKKLIIGAWHIEVIEWLRTALREFGAVTLFGGTPAERRQHVLDKFKNNRACRVLIVQVKVAIGFNATSAYRVDILEPSWVPADNKQCIDRAHRFGQEHPVTARFIGCNRSIDAYITRALANKSREIAKIFD